MQKSHIFYSIIATLLFAVWGCGGSKKASQVSKTNDGVNASNFSSVFIDACIQKEIGNTEQAIKLFKKAIELNATDGASYYEISQLNVKQEQLELAQNQAFFAYNSNTSNVYYALNYAKILKLNGNITKAIVVLEDVNLKFPKDGDLILELDNFYTATNNITKLIALRKKYSETKGFELQNALRLIELYKYNKDYVNAHKVYDEIKKAAPLKIQYYIEDANLYKEHNDEVNRILNLEKAVAINPNNFEINKELYSFYREKNNPKYEGFLINALKDTKTPYKSKMTLITSVLQNRTNDSINKKELQIVTKELEQLNMSDDLLFYQLGLVYEKQLQYQKAYLQFKKAYDINPNNFNVIVGMINALDKEGKLENMNKDIDNALELFPNNGYLYIKKASYFNQTKQAAEALKYIGMADKMGLINESNRLIYLEQKAMALIKTNQLDESEAIVKEILEKNGNEPNFNVLMGDILYKKGMYEKAMDYWQLARKNGNVSELLHQKIKNQKYVE